MNNSLEIEEKDYYNILFPERIISQHIVDFIEKNNIKTINILLNQK